MAKAHGVSEATVRRIWKQYGLRPHRVSTFKVSRHPRFVEKLSDVVGLYLNPPDKALVLCVDEKSQIQALDRTQPLLPLRPGQVQRHTHDYERHGTMSLFAALDVKSGRVIGQCRRRHRAAEFRDFLATIEAAVPMDLDAHLILDNSSTHKTPAIRRWFVQRFRFHLHFTLTSSSWINLVERWFAALTEKQLRRGAFRSTRDLETAIRNYLDVHNEVPKPFVWTKSADKILSALARFCRRTSDYYDLKAWSINHDKFQKQKVQAIRNLSMLHLSKDPSDTKNQRNYDTMLAVILADVESEETRKSIVREALAPMFQKETALNKALQKYLKVAIETGTPDSVNGTISGAVGQSSVIQEPKENE